jgi:predicted RNase H-like HicB family nuclease
VTSPALPGLATEGDTMEEARAMAEDALRLYLETLCEDMPLN